MLIHNVYFWLKEGVTQEQVEDFKRGTKKFLDAVEEIQQYEIGAPAGTPDRDVVDHSFDISIFVWFNNVDDHNVYQAHPAHEVFIESFNQLWAKVQVVDSNLIN